MLQTPLSVDKEILGYKLKQRIGSGGFGEVWSAEAPGGLLKAIKIVFGYHDGKRAQAELKALDRVKVLRHPFLLSLERIEVFEGQLVVVTELADCSLGDLYNKRVGDGNPGIERDEALRYMRCAAEALDYMSASHGLQHLDIKPENLLVVGEHVKVADFGLIKDLQQASQSLMSGMTPAYAAPELFDGRPHKNSDQYSLAIVYQEMITGHRPFSGNTPAQLAAQQMSGRPDIGSLSASDQPIIAKALAKDPTCRFDSCCTLVDELFNRRRSKKKNIRRRATARANEDSNTIALSHSNDGGKTHDVTALLSGGLLPFQAASVKVLDPPECNAADTQARPTLIIGVGATGNKIAQKIRTQLVARHGSMDNLPSIKLLAIDSNRDTVNDLVRNNSDPLDATEIIETPLKKPEVYRSQKKSHLGWLSRRWIYNIPRSLQTEGLRPLGRLAYADHFDTIYDRLEKSIREISLPENLATTADTLDVDPGEVSPRVYIVTSISGGIGSGMTLDLAYATRLILHECGFQPDAITGVLLHSTYQRMRDPGLSSANAFAFLTELRHYYEEGYAGDADNGVPEFDDVAPFDFMYFEDLGKDLRQSEFEKRLGNVAEYLLLASSSKCAAFFDKCRDFESQIDHFALRTFGISVTYPGGLSIGSGPAKHVGRMLLQYWIHGNETTAQQVKDLCCQLIDSKQLTVDHVSQRVQAMHDELFEPTLATLRQHAYTYLTSVSTVDVEEFFQIFDAELVVPSNRCDISDDVPELVTTLQTDVKRQAMENGENVVTEIEQLMSGTSLNLATMLKTSQSISEQFKDHARQLQQQCSSTEEMEILQLDRLVALGGSRHKGKPEWELEFEDEISNYLSLRTNLAVQRQTTQYFQSVSASVDSLQMVLDQKRRQLETVLVEFQDSVIVDSPDVDEQFNLEALLNESIQRDTETHVQATEQLVHQTLISSYGGYEQALESTTLWQSRLSNEIIKQSRRVLAEAYKKISLDKVLSENNVQPEVFAKWLNERMQEARPRVDNCGGGTRLLIGMPSLSNDSTLETLVENQFGVEGCPIQGTDGSFVVCFEGEDIGLANVAFRLLQERPDAIDLVKRIHTRSDIRWTTLNDLL